MRRFSGTCDLRMCWYFHRFATSAEALFLKLYATGVVPVVADFGGPGDIVNPEIGFKAPITE